MHRRVTRWAIGLGAVELASCSGRRPMSRRRSGVALWGGQASSSTIRALTGLYASRRGTSLVELTARLSRRRLASVAV